jgi:L-2-hydroxyglutarate oxidase LhgO
MEKAYFAIIGAGVAGLAVAARLAKPQRSVYLLEKNDSWGQETSSRNSEVIHAGIYYPPGSLKALSCVEGRQMLYDLCLRQRIPFQKTGKLIVAVEPHELAGLEKLKTNAARNGVELSLLTKAEVARLEPRVSCLAGLYSPETGIIDSHALMLFLLGQAQGAGAQLACRAQVLSVAREGDSYVLRINNQGEELDLPARVVVNCAGHHADKIAASCGIDIQGQKYEQYYLKGNYFRLSDRLRGLTRHLVYPLPQEKSLGVHTVLDLSGGVRLGPDEEEVKELDYRVNESRREVFYASIKKFLPCVRQEDIFPDIAGIRPQLKFPNRGAFRDFIVHEERDKGLPGLVNFIGIESPGLTSALYLAGLAADAVENFFKGGA